MLVDQFDEALRVPDVLQHAGRPVLDREPRPVEETGQVRERGRHVDNALAAHAKPAGDRIVRGDQRVVRVHDTLGFAGGAGREDQQGHVVGVRAERVECFLSALLLFGLCHECVPGDGARRVLAVGVLAVGVLAVVLAVDDDHVAQVRQGLS